MRLPRFRGEQLFHYEILFGRIVVTAFWILVAVSAKVLSTVSSCSSRHPGCAGGTWCSTRWNWFCLGYGRVPLCPVICTFVSSVLSPIVEKKCWQPSKRRHFELLPTRGQTPQICCLVGACPSSTLLHVDSGHVCHVWLCKVIWPVFGINWPRVHAWCFLHFY